MRSAISFSEVLGQTVGGSPRSPRSPRKSPVRSSTVSTGLAAINAAVAEAELEADPFHNTKKRALTRVVHLDTPASLAVVANGASGTHLLETGKRSELEDIVAELIARKQLQLAQHQFRNRQLKHMEMRTQDELRAMQQSIRKRTQAARELVRVVRCRECCRGDAPSLTRMCARSLYLGHPPPSPVQLSSSQSVQGIARAEQTLADERRSIAKLQAEIQSLTTQVDEVKAARDDALEERTTVRRRARQQRAATRPAPIHPSLHADPRLMNCAL